MTKNNLKVVKSTKDQELDNKEKNKALDAAISQIFFNIFVTRIMLINVHILFSLARFIYLSLKKLILSQL